jgi:arylsulfatase A-like enzyme
MRLSRSLLILAAVAAVIAMAVGLHAARRRPHNVILFVADGLRSQIVTPQTAPALAALRSEGVDFRNSHSLFPTVTTANASAMATGHYLGDTGDFGNYIWSGPTPLPFPVVSVMPAIEDDGSMTRLNERLGGNYLGEETLLAAARRQGFQTASIGKLGPASVVDATARDGQASIVIDDSTGLPAPDGIPLAADIKAAINALGLPATAPDRGLNAGTGAYNMPGTHAANIDQQDWFVRVATDVILPRFRKVGKPFVLVFWSRDPDGTQHNQGDSFNALVPGINGPTSMAGIRNASNDLQRLREALKAQHLDETTDIIVTADHGFSTATKLSKTSVSARLLYRDVKPGLMPPGFLAIDIGRWLKQPLWAPAGPSIEVSAGFHPRDGNALIGPDAAHPLIAVAANGGADLIYLLGAHPKDQALSLARFLTSQDYTGAIFVNDNLGPVPGALPMSAVNLVGSARTPQPSMVVSFASYSSGCPKADTCQVIVTDAEQQMGQGSHGTIGRGDTHNFMAAIGPDFKRGFVDPAPVSNADLAWTIAEAVGIKLQPKGGLTGRVIREALKGGGDMAFRSNVQRSAKAGDGFETVLDYQEADGRRYFDAAGMPGRVFGVKP